MEQILLLDFEGQAWADHPQFPGIQTRLFPVQTADHPALGTLIARVEPGAVIPWHVHEDRCELAYVLEGIGVLKEGQPDAHTARPLQVGCALFIGSGVWHAVENSGDTPLVLFAVHTQPKL